MTDLVGLAGLASHATLTWLSTHGSSWLADKMAGTAVGLPVKEAWETIKKKLNASPKGKRAVEDVEAQAGSAASVEGLREPLMEALASDPEFAKELAGLVVGGSYNQIANGKGIVQNQVIGSSEVSISVNR
jgi:hypothetical protein